MTFYDAVLAPLGIVRLWTAADAAGYGYAGTDEPFAIKRSDREPTPDERTHIAFRAPSRGAARPGLHPEYGPGYFAAFVRDPDSRRLEAVLHE